MPYTIVANIQNLPELTHIGTTEPASDLLGNPGFEAIKKRNRERAIEALTEPGSPLRENPQYTSSNPITFDRYNLAKEVTQRLGTLLNLHYPQARLQVQRPGGVLCMHVDDLHNGYMTPYEPMLPRLPFDEKTREAFDKDPSIAVRFMIFLEDGLPGQGIIFQDKPLVNWKKGDVVYWDWQTIPHATFNGSLWDRTLIRLTGIRTEPIEQLTQYRVLQYDPY